MFPSVSPISARTLGFPSVKEETTPFALLTTDVALSLDDKSEEDLLTEDSTSRCDVSHTPYNPVFVPQLSRIKLSLANVEERKLFPSLPLGKRDFCRTFPIRQADEQPGSSFTRLTCLSRLHARVSFIVGLTGDELAVLASPPPAGPEDRGQQAARTRM